MQQSTDFPIDSARVSVDDEDGFGCWTNAVSTEKAGAGNRAIWGSPFAQMTVQWFTHSCNDINFSCGVEWNFEFFVGSIQQFQQIWLEFVLFFVF